MARCLAFLQPIASWPEQRWPWILLASSASALVFTALMLQHVFGELPCEQCIYQRTAMIALAMTAWIASIRPQCLFFRLFGYLTWGASAFIGLTKANFHVWLQTGNNALFASCSFEPSFPAWLPLHDWLPSVFAVTGMCTDNSWSFVGWAMSEWMQAIFTFYVALLAFVLVVRFFYKRKV